MIRLRASLGGVLSAGFAGAMVLSPALALAQSGYSYRGYGHERAYPSERLVHRTPLEVWLSGEGYDEDYTHSDVCVGGYRWMTRNVDQGNSSAAQASVPVRC